MSPHPRLQRLFAAGLRALQSRLSPWLQHSVRHKLLAMALGPLVVVFPLLVGALNIWSARTYDQLLLTKVRSDLAVARGYFAQVLSDVGQGTQAVAESQGLAQQLAAAAMSSSPDAQPAALRAFLEVQRQRRGLDVLTLLPPGRAPPVLQDWTGRGAQAHVVVLAPEALRVLAPDLVPRARIPLLSEGEGEVTRAVEERAMLALAAIALLQSEGAPRGWLVGGVLLNHNLAFIDHINQIVYPPGSLPFGSQGTATLFLDNVRITTNVRLFEGERAIGTRVSPEVRDAVLLRGQTWLDRAYVVNDWYVSAYEPLLDPKGNRVGMLYVGVLEQPFRTVRLVLVGVMALIFLAAMALAAWVSVLWARSIFQPVEQMNRTMQRVQDGEDSARVGPLQARDELGALARHLDELLDRIAANTEALRRWGRELDARVAERTAELAASNASLRQAQEQLVRSEKLAVVGQLAASVAHEINNPLAIMQGNLDWMRENLGPAAEPVRSEMKLLDEQIARMRLIVQQLLQHARPDEYAGYTEALDINDAVRACLTLVQRRLERSHIAIELDLSEGPAVQCNRQELQQVIINLLINAHSAMPHGGTLLIATGNADNGRTLSVRDSGPGLSEEVLARLFEPFFTTKREGTGLGLWISRGLVERYGGRLCARNRSGARGAEFEVWLPSDRSSNESTDLYS